MKLSRLTAETQSAIPPDVLVALGAKVGDDLCWEIEGDGAKVRRATDASIDPKWRNATLIDSRTFGEWLSNEDEEAWRDFQ